MAELGEDAAEYHREVGAAATETGVDELIAVGPLARVYGGRAAVCDGRRGGRASATELVSPGDVVLVKGSRRWDSKRSRRNLTA